MLRTVCNEDDQSWLEVEDKFDRDGLLHLAINEMIPNHPNQAFKEQCVHLTRNEVAVLIDHLRWAYDSKNFGEK